MEPSQENFAAIRLEPFTGTGRRIDVFLFFGSDRGIGSESNAEKGDQTKAAEIRNSVVIPR